MLCRRVSASLEASGICIAAGQTIKSIAYLIHRFHYTLLTILLQSCLTLGSPTSHLLHLHLHLHPYPLSLPHAHPHPHRQTQTQPPVPFLRHQ